MDGERKENELAQYWMREADPNWMEEKETPDLVEDDDAVVTMATGIAVVGDVTAVLEEKYEEEKV